MTEEDNNNLKAMLTSEMVSRVTLAEAINIMHNLAIQEGHTQCSVAVEKKKDGQVSTQLGKYALSELSTENPRSIQQNKLPSLQIEEVEVAWESALSEAQGHRFSLDNELNERAETYINARVSSLEAGLSNRVERLKELSENPELNEKIRRMRQGQIINLTTTTKLKITELEALRDVTVSFKPVLAALLAVKE